MRLPPIRYVGQSTTSIVSPDRQTWTELRYVSRAIMAARDDVILY